MERLPGGVAVLTSGGVRELGARSLPGVGQDVLADCVGTLGATPRTPTPSAFPRGGVPFVPTVGVDSAQRPYSGAGFAPFTSPEGVYACRPFVTQGEGGGGGGPAGLVEGPPLEFGVRGVVFQFRDGSLYPVPPGAQVVAGSGYRVGGLRAEVVDAVPDEVFGELLTGGPTLFKGGVNPVGRDGSRTLFNILRLRPQDTQFYGDLAGTVPIEIKMAASVKTETVVRVNHWYATTETGTYAGGQADVTESRILQTNERQVVKFENTYTINDQEITFRAVFRAAVTSTQRDQWFIITDVTNLLGYEVDPQGRHMYAIVRTIVMPGSSTAPIESVEYYAAHPELLQSTFMYEVGIEPIFEPGPPEPERTTRLTAAGGNITAQLDDEGVLTGGRAFGRVFGPGTFAVFGAAAGPVLLHATPDGGLVSAYSAAGVETVTGADFTAGCLGRQPGAIFTGFIPEGCAAHEPPPVVFADTTAGPVMLTEWDAWRDTAPAQWPARPPQPRNPRENPPAMRPPLGMVGASFAAGLMGAEVRAQGQPWGHLPAAVLRAGSPDPDALRILARPPRYAPGGWLTDEVADVRALRPDGSGVVAFRVAQWAGPPLPPVRHLPPPARAGAEPPKVPDPAPGVAAYLLRVQARRDAPLTVTVNGAACEVLPLGPVPDPAALPATARYFVPVLALSAQRYEDALAGAEVQVSWAVSRCVLGRVSTFVVGEPDDGGGEAT